MMNFDDWKTILIPRQLRSRPKYDPETNQEIYEPVSRLYETDDAFHIYCELPGVIVDSIIGNDFNSG